MGLNLRLPCEAPEAGVFSLFKKQKKAKQKKKIKPPQKSTLCISATKLMFFCFFFNFSPEVFFVLFCLFLFCHHHFIALRSCKKEKKNTWTKYVNKITGTVPDDCKLSIYFWTCLSYFEQR